MATDDGYEAFRRLQFELSRRGLESEAIALEVAYMRGTGRAGRLALAGEVIASLKAANPALCERALAPFIDTCITEIRCAWPDYH